jgi:hypothetical protein
VLKAAVLVEADRVAAAALDGALDPSVPSAQRSRAALALIDAVDPPMRSELEVSVPIDAEGVQAMGLDELRALAAQVRGD